MKNRENQPMPLFCSLDENFETVVGELGNSTDLVTRKVRMDILDGIEVGMLFTEGLVDKDFISQFMESLMLHAKGHNFPIDDEREIEPLPFMKDFLLTIGGVEEVYDFDALFNAILTGETVILVEGYSYGFIANTKKWEDRGVQEASVQTVVRGAREAFSESLRTNTALVRRRINNRKLWLETRQIGKMTQTNVGIMYIKGVVDETVLAEVHQRLDRISIDGILESGNIEELI